MGFPAPIDRATEAGAEPGAEVVEIDLYYAGGDGYGQLWVEIIGYVVATPPPGRMHLTIPYSSGQPALTIVYLRERVWCEDSLVFGQIDWRPELGVGSIHGFNPYTQKLEDLRPVWRALKVLGGIRIQPGGSPKGPRKGQVWSRQQCLEWWASWVNLDRTPTQADLAADMLVRDPATAVTRWRDTGLHWPPSQEEIDELESD